MKFDLSKIDVEDFLNELGVNNISKKGKEYFFSCPLPRHIGVDHTPSISMEEGTTKIYCFGCKFGGNAVSFLAELEEISPLKAKHWIRERFNVDIHMPEEGFKEAILKKIERMKNPPEKDTKQINYTTIDESELDKRFIDWDEVHRSWQGKIEGAYPLAYMLDRGFKPNTLNEWAFGWDMISQRICFPIRDQYGNLLGLKGRTTDPNERSRYLVLGGPEYGFDTYNVSRVLFGLDKVLSKNKEKDLIVVEGELNTVSMHQKGFINTVGISGKNLSQKQVDLIKEHSESATFIFDDFRDTLDAANQLDPFIPTKLFPEHHKDPADMEGAEINDLLLRSNSLLCYNITSAII
jgi:DNA primase